MKYRINTKILVFISIFSLLVPSLPQESSADFSSPQLTQPSGEEVVIRVVNVEVPKLSSAPLNFFCQTESQNVSNLVQTGEIINLNQPESCFGLNLGRVTVQDRLFVNTWVELPQVQVARANTVSVPNLDKGQLPQNWPALPSASASVVIIITAFGLAISRLRLPKILFQLRYVLTLNQIRVYRC